MSRICLCGSYDDKEVIYNIGRTLLKHHSIYIPAFYLGRRPSPKEQNSLMLTHFERMSVSDKILVICYSKIGANTLIEIGYALALNKEVYILVNKELEIPDEFFNFRSFNCISTEDDTAFYNEDLIKWMK